MNKYILYLLLSINLLSCSNDKANRDFSFYYRDHINLIDSFPQYKGAKISTTNPHIIVSGESMHLQNPESLQVEDLKFNILFTQGDNTDTVPAKIRCWREDGPYLEEETSMKWFQSSYVGRKYTNAKKKLFKTGYNSILLTQNDTTYYMEDGDLCWRTTDDDGVLSDQIRLNRSEYNQMLKVGNVGIIRTEGTIYASADNQKTWKIIHSGSRALCKSLIFDKDNNSLIYSNYTGGDARVRHYLRRYNFDTQNTDTLLTFYTKKEHDEQGLSPFARHIHVIDVDPYSGGWYIGVGDYDGEPAIYRTCDKGQTFQMIGSGEQMWRTLSFIFRKDYIFWGADSESPQYLSRINRSQLDSLPIKDEDVVRFPLFNSALWFTYEYDGLTIMHSNSEGSFYDDYHRIYGIEIDGKGIPTVYSLFKEKSDPEKNNYIFNQLFFLEKDIEDNLWFYDNQNNINRKFKLVRDKHE